MSRKEINSLDLYQVVEEMILEAKRLVDIKAMPIKVNVMCSGGVDSFTLLNILNDLKGKLRLNLFATTLIFGDYVGEIKAVNLVKSFCEKNNIGFIQYDAKLDEISGNKKVYVRNVLKEYSVRCRPDIVVTGHHKDDRIETIFNRLFSGRLGPDGVNGFKAFDRMIINKTRTLFVKPFYNVEKNTIIEFANKHSIKYVEDLTNFDPDYCERNYIRNIIIPLIKEKFDLDNTLRAMDLIANHITKLQDDIKLDFRKGVWKTEEFNQLNLTEAYVVVKRHLMQIYGVVLNKDKVAELRKVMLNKPYFVFELHRDGPFKIVIEKNRKNVKIFETTSSFREDSVRDIRDMLSSIQP